MRQVFSGAGTNFPLMAAPRPVPVSDALTIAADAAHGPLRDAVVSIDRVHGDGALPTIPLRRVLLTDQEGRFVFRDGGPAVGIEISHFTDTPELTTVHEIGHFIDYHGLGTGAQCGSLASAELRDWRSAVRGSRAVQSLRHSLSGASVVQYSMSQPYLRYLLKPQELWARSYVQFIAIKSGSPTLLGQLDLLRERPANAYYYAVQWEDADFVDIFGEIEALFRQKGWMR